MACFWSAVVFLTIIMDGYDTTLLRSLQAYPFFRFDSASKLAALLATKSPPPGRSRWCFESAWKYLRYLCQLQPYRTIRPQALSTGNLSRFHRNYLHNLFAPTIEVLFVGELFPGMCCGVFTTLAAVHASEVCPVVLRNCLEMFVVLC